MAKNKDEEKKSLSRREFLKDTGMVVGGAALTMGALSLAGCASPEAETTTVTAPGTTKTTTVTGPGSTVTTTKTETATPWLPSKWDYEADVVVVGAGGAGLSASNFASDAGAQVILLEKMSVVGGSSAICGGGLFLAGTDEQKERGIEDSNDLLFDDLMKAGKYRNDTELVRAYVNNQLAVYRWLKTLGITFAAVEYAESSVPRAHYTDPANVIQLMRESAETKGVKILLNTPGKRVLRNAAGRAVGVKAEQSGKDVYFKARQAVILSAGGFSRNPEMLETYRPGFSMVVAMTSPGTTGDGLKMAQCVGCDLKDMGEIKATYAAAVKGDTIGPLFMMYWSGAIIVNKYGKRFVNESKGHKEIPEFALQQPDGVSFQIFDKKISESGAALGSMEQVKDFVVQANSIEELATKLGIDPSTLDETVSNYNSYVEAGEDPECGRVTLTAEAGKPIKIDEPPFYGVESKSVILGTYCGCKIDKDAHVINAFGEIVPGLYAAGEIFGGFHGGGYCGGSAFGKALVFGYIAANKSVTEIPWV